MYMIPPNLEMCNKHREAHLMKMHMEEDPKDKDICPCCGNVYVNCQIISKYI